MESIDPTTGRAIARYREMTAREIARVIDRAHSAFREWKDVGFSARAKLMRRLASLLRKGANAYALLMAQEMGKAVREGRAEVEKCAVACDYFARHAEEFLHPMPVATEMAKSTVTFRPLGVILAVMPWNFPFWQVVRFAAPALMAGNGAVLKHASNVSGCALALDDLVRRAGFPRGLFGTVIAGSRRVDAMIAHPAIAAVTLTGSTPAGRAVAATAGRHLKKCVLELGGSDPYVILADADLAAAAAAGASGRFVNAGQSCIAAKRFIVVEKVRRRFERLLVAEASKRVVGDPRDERTEIGPLARADLRDELHRQVRRSVAMGARCLLGGRVPRGNGAFYPPTVLTDVRKGMPVYDEETFGPVAVVIAARDEREALRIANDTPFGLGAAVFTRNRSKGERIAADELEAGSCFVNAFVRSDPRLPFGGIKASGFGRELSTFGIREFVNIKTVCVK